MNKMVYCNQCGTEVQAENSFCEECGAQVAETSPTTGGEYSDKSRPVAIMLALFFGLFGVHKFYLNEIKMGAIYLAISWTTIPFFLGIYDAFKYYTNESKFEGQHRSPPPGTGTKPGTGTNTDDTAANRGVAPDDAVMRTEGVNGTVTLYNDRVEISREDIGMLHRMQQGFKGDKDIPLDSITSVQLRKPSTVTRGYVQLGQSGYHESSDGLMDATSDENTVLFEKESLAEFQQLREKIRELSKQDVESLTGDIDEAMEKLRERYADGQIDEEEYEKRKEVLDSG